MSVEHPQARFDRRDGLALAGLMLVAAALRFYRLADAPPGLLSDTAINGLDAWRWVHRGGWAVFLPGNGGREGLMVALQALSIAVGGTTALAVRLPGALVDWLAVGLGFWLARRLAPPAESRRWAWFAGLSLAVSPWLLPLSRLGFRAALVAPVSMLAAGAFWLGWRRTDWRRMAVAGAWLGLLLYTYSAARVMPLVVAIALLPELRRIRRWTARRWVGLGAMAGSFLAVSAPMLAYTAAHPAYTLNRTGSVAVWAFADTPAAVWRALADNALAVAGYFCCAGNSHLPMFGWPGKPALDAGLGLVLLVGLAVAVKNGRRLSMRLLVVWLALGLVPGLLAIEAPHPLRLIAAAPPVALLLALGMTRLSRRRPWLVVGFSIWLLVTGGLAFRDDWLRWPNLPQTQAAFKMSQAQAAEDVLARVQHGQVIYLPQRDYARPVMRYLLSGPLPPRPVTAFVETEATVTYLGPLTETAWVRLGDGQALILPPADAPPPAPLSVSIGPARLTGAAFPATLSATDALTVTLFWQATARPAQDYRVLAQLVDDARQGWSLTEAGQAANGAYPTSLWRPGAETVPDTHRLRLKPNLPTGRYWLAVALVDAVTNERLPVEPQPGFAPDTAFIGPLKMAPPPPDPARFAPAAASFGGVVSLAGFHVEPDVQAGQATLPVELLWQAAAPIDGDFTVFVHLLDEAGQLVAGHDAPPMAGSYPTGLWSAGEQVADNHPVDVSGLLPGRYTVEVGLYRADTGERLPLSAGDGRLPVTVVVR